VTFRDLSRELLLIMERGIGEALPDSYFSDIAIRMFQFQCKANRPYGGFVARRGVDPGAVTSWREIPFLPTRAFKSAALVSGDCREVDRVFRTSGTTLGEAIRGEHHVLELDLYRRSLLVSFTDRVLGGMPRGVRTLCLLPSSEAAPASSLSFMMNEVVEALGGEGSGFFVGPDGKLVHETFWQALQAAEKAGSPVLLAGTAFGFVQWLEIAEERSWRVALPRGSRIMETGGYKGRSREVPRGEFYEGLQSAFGVEARYIVNEYGMTELLSQFYEPVLGTGRDQTIVRLADRYHRGPPWVRTLVLDPMTLEEVPAGQEGILAHLDLANLGSVAAVLTEDLGRVVRGGFHLLGRRPGSEPRGCSLAMEDFLASRSVQS
jgi:hypothetical protein